MAKIHGGRLIARALLSQGVDTVFTLTGGHILPILDGCVEEGIRVVDFRHEQAAAHAAEAYGRLTGRLGVAVVTAGPGVTDTITAVANAWYSNTPMLVVGGRHLLRQELKGGLQEMDHPKLFEGITAWAATAFQPGRLADYIATAARFAFAGRGAPVFLDVPMDVQFDEIEESVVFLAAPRSSPLAGADRDTLDAIVAALTKCRRPMIFAGTGARGQNHLAELAELLCAPTYLNSRARGSLPYGHRLLGNHSRSQAMASTDLVLALGVDWDFRAKYGETVPEDAIIIHIDADPTKIGWNRDATIGLVADPMMVVTQLVGELPPVADRPFTTEIMDADRSMQSKFAGEADDDSSPVMPHRFARDVSAFFGPDAIVAVDGGDIVSTTARWLQISTPGHMLDPGPFGTLGTGASYAIAAKVAFPDKLVGIVYGDGAFGFNGFEFDTMVRLGLPIVGVIGNDGVWANIKTIHKAFFPDRVVAADLGRRPYHAVVEALGGYGELVTDPDQIRPALERAAASGKPALVNVHLAETTRTSSNYAQ